MRRTCLAILLAMICTPAFAQDTAPRVCGVPTPIGDGWPIDKPENVGVDGARLCGIADRLAATNANVHAVVVARHGKLVFEQYFSGYDDPWGVPEGQFDFDATTKHDMRSISKSVTSLLVGIAIDRKLIGGVDEPVVKFFPEFASLKTPGWDNITIRNLLTMSSGIKWDEIYPGPILKTTSLTSGRTPNPFAIFSGSRLPRRPTQSGIIMGAEPICSAASSNGSRESRLTLLRARHCFSRWGSPIGCGRLTKMARFHLPPVFASGLAMRRRSVSLSSMAAPGAGSKSSPQHGSSNQ